MSKADLSNADFIELFNSFFGNLKRIAFHICGDEEVAEELAQEAFLRYYERRHRLPVGNEARYWLIRVVRNLAFNHEKRRGREKKVYRDYAQEQQLESQNEGERIVLEEEARKDVREALDMMPYKLRITLILKEYAGFPYATIAKILRISENNVKIRVFRARQYLSKLLR